MKWVCVGGSLATKGLFCGENVLTTGGRRRICHGILCVGDSFKCRHFGSKLTK